ncbi:DUF4407 domain-containing protein [Streptomyces sp. NPDC101219]|uniref:DUF4407 domain-containing protein n=1 Tax=Streptomyces sp. NPDC101219 TaxID=3366131 RepID=UPI0038118D27
MATDTPLRPDTGSVPSHDDRGSARPAPRATGPGTRLRRLIGIDESLLAWVPEERTRYTWYGALVLNTALVGAVSMALALGSFRSDLPVVAVLTAAAVWFWVILAMDSWLVSSTHGTKVKKWSLALRLVLSVLLGLFIAEPILFQIFDKEIRQQIAVGREQEVADYRGMLVACNPTDGASTVNRPECGRYQLKVAGSPAELTNQIEANKAAMETLQSQVTEINEKLDAKMATERRQCGPDRWIRRGGGWDVTITCERARNDSSSYRRTSKIDTYEKQLAGMREKGQTLESRKNRAADAYQPLLQKAIDTKTAARAADLDSDGILTRAHALRKVAESDGFALFITVVLHLLLVSLDALPVLAKFMSGATEYDRVLGVRFDVTRRLHTEELQVAQACARMEHEVRRHHVEHDTTDRMRRTEHTYQRAQAERAAQEREELESRMATILRSRSI